MPKGDITVYAFLIAAPGKSKELLATLTRSQKYCESGEEPGCLQYRISVDPRDEHKANQEALDFHIASEVSKLNVAFYEAGGLAAPLSEMDIRIYTEYRAD